MKRVRCPKCDNYITFDETKYEQGQTLVFNCDVCKKEFKIRLGAPKVKERPTLAVLTVVENVFHYRQELAIKEGENIIGRYVKGTAANLPIETVDPSIDTTHCIITAKRTKKGNYQFILRDAPSNTGTFLMNEILADNDRRFLHEGDIITIGATTMIFKEGPGE